MSGHKHRKRFGQHFLHDQNIIFSLLDIINPGSNDFFLEIGPGEAALTTGLLASGAEVCALEIDRDLVNWLNKQNFKNFKVIETDVLAYDFLELKDHAPIRCVGNLPYNISTPLLFQCFENIELWQDMHFMLQQEVVLRLAADVGTKHYSRLSVMAQAVAQVSALLVVPKECFTPPPKVESQIVRLVPRDKDEYKFCFATLSKVVKIAFTHRRKTLNNNFKGILNADNWAGLDIKPSLRPQELEVVDFIKIANYFSDNKIFDRE